MSYWNGLANGNGRIRIWDACAVVSPSSTPATTTLAASSLAYDGFSLRWPEVKLVARRGLVPLVWA